MNEGWITFISSEDLIARIRKDRAAFAAAWDGLTPEQMTRRPGPQADWSVKDLIAHITSWETRAMDHVRVLTGGEEVDYDYDVDEVNTQVFEVNKDRPLDEVLREFIANLNKLESQIGMLTDAQLNDESLYKGPGHTPRMFLIGNTFGHYEDHIDDLHRYVASVRGEA